MKKGNEVYRVPKPAKLENPLNQEIWHCNDIKDIRYLGDEEYLLVFKLNMPNRVNLMKKSALVVKR